MHAVKKLQLVFGVVVGVVVLQSRAAAAEAEEERVVATLGSYEVFESTLGEDNAFRALRTKSQGSATLQEEKLHEGEGVGGVLGGVFTSGIARGESVFSAFHVHEAVRLVLRDEAHPGHVTALQVGLGIGIVATALERHGIIVDAVEIDADVLEAAHLYFGYRAEVHTTGDGEDNGDDQETTSMTRGRDYVEDGARFLQRALVQVKASQDALHEVRNATVHLFDVYEANDLQEVPT